MRVVAAVLAVVEAVVAVVVVAAVAVVVVVEAAVECLSCRPNRGLIKVHGHQTGAFFVLPRGALPLTV